MEADGRRDAPSLGPMFRRLKQMVETYHAIAEPYDRILLLCFIDDTTGRLLELLADEEDGPPD